MKKTYVYEFTKMLKERIEVMAENEDSARIKAHTKFNLIPFDELEGGSVNCGLIEVIVPDIKIGDMVRVVNMGNQYTSYAGFFYHHNLSTNIANRFIVDNPKSLSFNKEYLVLFSGKHEFQNDTLYVIEDVKTHDVYLIGQNGIELA